ncbi:YslB family protein [Limosilactobacillus sp. RRLNB_1_1]|uniref:YslB family protein n=1 Tax=Limosilactobacillus albertensis TaxID=2759752 RepID=A0A7W3TPS3_9LACO|nr:YslB family protein [Limosilactobacillus albertensis]MBB1068633.1 YslB family protein [Limosilactobacillus albertensis]MCD7118224.1 YslB family protein [Limosilactobacillus albertensis]MCD7127478.1 YslB family protein [Limosilactobacillus albertensis]
MSQKLYNQLIASHQGLGVGTMRDVILPAILGKETDEMLYWIGKDLARVYPVATTEDLIHLTNQLGFGRLALRKKSNTSQVWRLSGVIVKERIQRNDEETSFGLECGFLAQEIEFQLGTVAEAKIFDRHRDYVEILIQNDPQNSADNERSEMVTFINIDRPDSEEEKPKKEGRHSLLKLKRKEKK